MARSFSWPDNPEVATVATIEELYQAARAAQANGQIDSATRLYRRTLAQAKTTSPAVAAQCSRLIATCLRSKGMWVEALKLLLTASRRYSPLDELEKALIERDIGLLFQEKGQLRWAEIKLQRAVRRMRALLKASALQPSDQAELGLCLTYLSQIYWRRGNVGMARQALQSAGGFTINAPDYHATTLIVHAEQNRRERPDLAIEALRSASEIIGERHAYLAAKIYALLAHCYLENDEREEAWKAYTSCLMLLEQTDGVIQGRARVRWRLRELGSTLGIG